MFRDDVDDQHVNALSDDPHDHCLKMFACYTCQAVPGSGWFNSSWTVLAIQRLHDEYDNRAELSNSVEDNSEMMLLIVRMVSTTLYVG